MEEVINNIITFPDILIKAMGNILSHKGAAPKRDRSKAPRKKTIPKTLKRSVWEKYAGSGAGSTLCYVGCGQTITPFDFEAGHVVAEAKGGPTDVENLRPICSLCNKSMGSKEMGEFAKSCGFRMRQGA